MNLLSDIHQSLTKKSTTYQSWHSRKYSSHIHFSVLIVFFIAISLIGAYFLVPQQPERGEAATIFNPDFPRLAVYMPPTSKSVSDLARYDQVVFLPTETDNSRIAAIRALNPDVKILTYLTAHQVTAFPSSGYTNRYNAETRSLSTDWMMTKIGSTTAGAITTTVSPGQTTETTVQVQAGEGVRFSTSSARNFVLIGGTSAQPFTGDSPQNRTTEIARVKSISGDTLTLTRGEFWPTKSHNASVRIAPLVQTWDYLIDTNIAVGTGDWICPKVNVGYGTEDYNGWNARRSQTDYNLYDFDGVFDDVFGWFSVKNVAGIDGNRNNIADSSTEISNWVNTTKDGLAAQASAVRSLLGSDAILVGNGTYFSSTLNGLMYEGWPGISWDLATWRTYFGSNGSPPSYASYPYSIANSVTPSMSVVVGHGGKAFSGTYGTANFTAADYAYFRYSFATALLSDGYYTYDDDASGYSNNLWWYDEYSVNSSGIATGDASSKGYLGQPTSGAYDANTKSAYTSSTTVYRRDYDNGIAIVNPDTTAHTVTLGATYKKIKGTQDPNINDGSSVTSITLQPKDGIILMEPEPITHFVSPSGSAAWANCIISGTSCSFATALSNVAPGDIVRVSAGTYASRVTLSRSGSSTASVTWNFDSGVALTGGLATTGDYNVVNGNYFSTTGYSFTGSAISVGGNHNVVHDFTLTDLHGTSTAQSDVDPGTDRAGVQTSGTYNEVYNFTVTRAGNSGMYPGGSNNFIHNFTLDSCGYKPWAKAGVADGNSKVTKDSIEAGGTYNTLEDGLVTNSWRNGMYLYGSNNTFRRIEWRNNIAPPGYENDASLRHKSCIMEAGGAHNAQYNTFDGNIFGSGTHQTGISYEYDNDNGTGEPKLTLINSIFYTGTYSTLCILLQTESGSKPNAWVHAYNNVFYGNPIYNGAAGTFGDGMLTFKNNIFYGQVTSWTVDIPASKFTLGNNLYDSSSNSSIPSPDSTSKGSLRGSANFVSSTDWHLTASSAAIDAGIQDANTPTTDKDGNPRIGNPDIGAYEYQSSGGTTCNTSTGDLNSDGHVNISDAAMLMAKWNQTISNDPADLNCSGKVDISDAAILMAHWGT